MYNMREMESYKDTHTHTLPQLFCERALLAEDCWEASSSRSNFVLLCSTCPRRTGTSNR